MDSDFINESFEDELDPRIEDWLDVMNTSSNSINQLENEFQKLLKIFQKSKKKALLLLEETNKKLGARIVRKARKYYETIREIEATNADLQEIVSLHEKSVLNLGEAKSNVQKIEKELFSHEKIKSKDKNDEESVRILELNTLNDANDQLLIAKKETSQIESLYHIINDRLKSLENTCVTELNQSAKQIAHARAYYEMEDRLINKIMMEKQAIEDLSIGLFCQQQKYQMALNSLEEISEEMHERRKDRRLMMVMRKMTEVRTPGEGAEDTSDIRDPSNNQDAIEDFYAMTTKKQIQGDDRVDQLRRADGFEENFNNNCNFKNQLKTNTPHIVENEACKSGMLDCNFLESKNEKEEESESSLDELYFQSSYSGENYLLGKKSSEFVADGLQKFEKYLNVEKLDKSQKNTELQSVLNDSEKKLHTDSELKDTISKIFFSQPNCFHQFPEPAFSSASSSRSSSFRSQKNKNHNTVLDNDTKILKSDSSIYTTDITNEVSGINNSAINIASFKPPIFSSPKFVFKAFSTTPQSNRSTPLFGTQNTLNSLNKEVPKSMAFNLPVPDPPSLKSTEIENQKKAAIWQVKHQSIETLERDRTKLDSYVLNEKECQKALMNTASLKSGIYSVDSKFSLYKQLPQQPFPQQKASSQQSSQSKPQAFWSQVKLKLSKIKDSQLNQSSDSTLHLQEFIKKEMQKIVLENPCSHEEVIKNAQFLHNISQNVKQEKTEKYFQSHQPGDRDNLKMSSQESTSNFISQHNKSTLTPSQKSLSVSTSSLSKLYF